MRRRLAGVVLTALAVSTGCGGGDPDPAALAPPFCAAWDAAMAEVVASGDESAIDAVLADAPPELDGASDDEILNWIELHCRPGERRVAPAIDAAFEGLTFCSTTGLRPPAGDGGSGMVLYGDADADDPYDGPMLGLFWKPADGGDHSGDGEAEPVMVRGLPGVAAPITVFQQAVLPDLGTVIAWTEGDVALGLYGRGWPMERAGELVAIADQLEAADGRYGLAPGSLPSGYDTAFAGSSMVTSIVFPPDPRYSLRYQGDGEFGLLDVHGLRMDDDEFEAFRFFTVGVDQGDAGGREGLVGNAWHADGPVVVTWREPDGLVVRIVGVGVPLDVALQVATASRELTEDEWAALVEAEDPC